MSTTYGEELTRTLRRSCSRTPRRLVSSTRTSSRSPRSSTAPVPSCTTTARTSMPCAASRARATWDSTSCTSTCTRRSRSHMAEAGQAAARSRGRACRGPSLPVPAVIRRNETENTYGLDFDRPKSIGKVRGYTGPFGVFVRTYASLRMYGPRLREMSETAVLNANYIRARLEDTYELPFDRLCMHEFVLSARAMKREHGVTALDVAKRRVDYGSHPPTIYFPLIVPEALMIEPTETEAKETLDAFCDAMLTIAAEAREEPELLKGAPHHRPVQRLDEVRAAKQPVVKYGFDEHPNLPAERAPVAAEAPKGV